MFERETRAYLARKNVVRSAAYDGFRHAMEWYERAEQLRPAGNDDALLRWNSCVRAIERERLEPEGDEPRAAARVAVRARRGRSRDKRTCRTRSHDECARVVEDRGATVAAMHTRTLALLVFAAACGSSAPPVAAPPPAPQTAAPVEAAPAQAQTAPPAAGPDLATRRKALSDLLAEQWEYNMVTQPEYASILGDHRFDDRWSDHSLDAIAADNAKQKDFLARFEAIDATGFPEQEALSRELMVRQLRDSVSDQRFESWLMPVNQFSGVQLELATVPTVLRFESVADYEHYLTRLHGIPKIFEQMTALVDAGVAKHLVPPKILLVQCVPQTRALATGKPADSPFAAPVVKFPDAIAKADQDRLRAAIVGAVKGDVMPAYAHFADYLEKQYVPHGRAEPGEWALPDGVARYTVDVRESTTTDLTPDQIHQIGLDEVARIEGEEAKLATKLGFPSLAELRAHVKTDKKLYAKDRADILERYDTYLAQMYDKLPSLFGHLPTERLKVEEVEAYRAKAFAGAEYQPGLPDGSRKGAIKVNTSDPTHRLWISMESTAYHEGVPGHHLQISIAAGARRAAEVPAVRRLHRVRRGLGAVRRAPRRGRRLLPGPVVDVRPPRGRDAARDPPRGRHGLSREEVDARPGRRVLPRPLRDRRAERAERDRPLHRVAGAGARLQDRPADDPAPARRGQARARRRVRHPRVPRRGARRGRAADGRPREAHPRVGRAHARRGRRRVALSSRARGPAPPDRAAPPKGGAEG